MSGCGGVGGCGGCGGWGVWGGCGGVYTPLTFRKLVGRIKFITKYQCNKIIYVGKIWFCISYIPQREWSRDAIVYGIEH